MGITRQIIRQYLSGWLAILVLATTANGAITPFPALTNAAQVRSLSPQQAAQALPVQLQGVILADSAEGNSIILQDASEAIYTTGNQALLNKYRSGDVLEITGVTDPGGFAPIILLRSCRKIGTAPLPAPHRVTFDDLTRRYYDAQFVEITGIVRSCEPNANTNDPRSKMVVATGGDQLPVRFHTRLPPDSLVDAEVRLRGICFCRYSAGRQFLSLLLDVPSQLTPFIEKPAPANPWGGLVFPVAELLKFTPGQDYGHRVRVQGVVTHQNSGALWLRDGNVGLQVRTTRNLRLQPGEVVDVLGFPSRGDYSPMLEDADLRKISNSVPPLARSVTNLVGAVHLDANLIQFEAKLNSRRPVQDGWVLTLDWLGTLVEARVTLPNGVNPPADWLPGSRVRVAGICTVAPPVTRGLALSGIWEPSGFSLLLRSPADLLVLKPAPWWTPVHVSILLAVVVGGLLLTAGVGTLLARRRLNEQERQRAMAEAEFTAILSERNRMAREIHDTLAQGLVATNLQLRLAKKQTSDAPAALHQHLDAAQQLVHASLQEARNSIWNMRSQVLETGDLVGALQNILKQMADGTEMKTHFEVTGRPRRLAPVIESNSLRVGQEAITNATKHAAASQLHVKLEFGEKRFRLLVTDNGNGFQTDNAKNRDGGFGLVGMRERATELKGELTIRSEPGQGTEISLSLPLTSE